MTFPILGGNSAVGGYAIDNSLRYNNNDSPELSRTPSSAGNKKTFTFSTWLKRGELSSHSGGASSLLVAGISTNILNFRFQDSGILNCILSKSGSTANGFAVDTDAVFRDVSAYYHILLVVDTTQASITDAVKIYVNNTLQSFSSSSYGGGQNVETPINDTLIHSIGYNTVDNNQAFDGYLAETHLIDGQALSPTDFGEFDEDSGIWKPIRYTGTYGTNGFYLDFEDSGSLGADQSGNGNDFTPTNLASTDQTTDTPTNNFATLNPLIKSVNTNSEGNLKSASTSGVWQHSPSTIAMSNGKWYFEVYLNSSTNVTMIGIADANSTTSTVDNDIDEIIVYRSNNGNKLVGGSYSSYGSTFTTGDIIGVALDMDSNNITFYKNNTSQGPISHSFSSVYFDTLVSDAASLTANFGQDSSFAGNETRQNNSDENGYGDFYYSPPSGYLALCTQNLATELSPTIDDGSQYFNTVLYTGTGVSNSVTGVGFQPDFVWEKARNAAGGHGLYDAVRGVERFLRSNSTDAEQNTTNGTIDSFDVDGFTLNADTAGNSNYSGRTYVAWNWLAGGTGVSNTDGSITSTVSANTTAGFSIVTYTGTGTTGTVGHGLGKVPKVLITKDRDTTFSWNVYHAGVSSDPETDYLVLEGTDAVADNVNRWNDTAPTSSVFTVASSSPANTSGNNILAYCFAEIEGYSKFGSYTGNASTDGTFIYTGFRPAWVMVKNTATGTSNWEIHDSTRTTINPTDKSLFADSSNAETSSRNVDFLSNGFKQRNTFTNTNGSGHRIIFMAFAESPFVTSTSIPVTAR